MCPKQHLGHKEYIVNAIALLSPVALRSREANNSNKCAEGHGNLEE